MLSDVISLSVFIEEFIPWQILERYAFIQNLYSNLKGKLYVNKSALSHLPSKSATFSLSVSAFTWPLSVKLSGQRGPFYLNWLVLDSSGKMSCGGAATAWEFSVKSSYTIFLSRGLTARLGNTVEQLTFFIVRSTIFVLDDIKKIFGGSFWHIMYHIKANRKHRCVRIYFVVRTSVTGIINNAIRTSLLCQERSWNVRPLQPRLFVARWPNNTALFGVKKVQWKTKLEHGIAFVFVFRI